MRKVIRVFLCAVAAGFLFVGNAYAHAAYLRSDPSADAVIASAPARVDIWFEEELYKRKGANAILVTGSDGQPASTGETLIDDDDRTHAWVELRPGLPPGVYSVAWKSLSLDDGDAADGVFTFTVDPQAKATSTPMEAGLPTHKATESDIVAPSPTAQLPVKSNPGGPCAAGAMPLLVLAGLVAYRARKR